MIGVILEHFKKLFATSFGYEFQLSASSNNWSDYTNFEYDYILYIFYHFKLGFVF